ncbi:hypothetical protein Tco_1548888 [Tanacetum coccineum]
MMKDGSSSDCCEPSNVSTLGPLNVSDVGPSTSTVGDIFEDEMTTIADTLVAIKSARLRTTSIMIHNVEEETRDQHQRTNSIKPSTKKGRSSLLHRELNKLETSHQPELNSGTKWDVSWMGCTWGGKLEKGEAGEEDIAPPGVRDNPGL